MVIKDFEVTKIYWSISEVAVRFNVAQSLIRFWEKEFDELQPKKNTSGNRLFTVKDIDVFETIYTLVKTQGMTLDGAKKKMKEYKKQAVPPNNKNLRQRLEQLIDRLEELKKII